MLKLQYGRGLYLAERRIVCTRRSNCGTVPHTYMSSRAELKGAIDVLKGHDDKIRCILNKADQIDRQQLMRVYGALLWSLGKTMPSPEVARVYVGSFWNHALQNTDNAELFEMEEKDLMKDLAILPRQSAVRKINELVKRIRKVKTLAYIVGHLKSQMPAMVGKEKKQKKLINDLPNGTPSQFTLRVRRCVVQV